MELAGGMVEWGWGGKHVETVRGGNEKRMIKRWTDLEK